MKTVLKVLVVVGITFVVLVIVLITLMQRSCNSDKYFAIRDAKVYLFRVDGRQVDADTVFESQNRIDHVNAYTYDVLHADNVWNDSLQFGILIDFDVAHCDDCSSFMDAHAATMPGILGTRQRIKSLGIAVSDSEGRSFKDISGKLSADSLSGCVYFSSFKSSSCFFDRDSYCGKRLSPVYVKPGLAAFRDTFNLNHFRGGVPPLIFLLPSEEISTFPDQFKLQVKLIFEDGFMVQATSSGRHESAVQ